MAMTAYLLPQRSGRPASFSRPEAGWAQTFQALVADGTLPRDRVLENCLRALGRDFSAYRAGWFAQLYRSLEPTAAESVAYQPLLLRLLRSAVPATVSFAVGQLSAVAKAGALDDERYVALCAAAMVVPAKSTAAAVKLAAGVAQRRPDLDLVVANAVGAALGHSHRNVQAQALAVLKTLAANEIVIARLDDLEPSVRRAAAEWLGVPVPGNHETGPTPMIHPARAGGPAQDTTVAELGARLLAGHLAATDVERFLAALAVKDTAGLQALRKQATKSLSDPRWATTLRQAVAALVAAVTGESPAATGPDMFLARRLGEVLDIVTGRRAPAQLLATPTDAAGWLDPEVFVARLAVNPDPPMFDFAAALLRLAPGGRAEALRSARTLPGEAGAVARYALGGAGSPAAPTRRRPSRIARAS